MPKKRTYQMGIVTTGSKLRIASILCGTLLFVITTSLLFSYRGELFPSIYLTGDSVLVVLGFTALFMVHFLNRGAAIYKTLADRFIAGPILFAVVICTVWGVSRYCCERQQTQDWWRFSGEIRFHVIVESILTGMAAVIGGVIGAFAEWLFWRPNRRK